MFKKYTAEEKKVLETAMIINAMCGMPAPTTEKEVENWCDGILKAKAEREQAEAEKKAKAEAREKAKAEAAGKTVEELRAEKKAQAKIRRYEREIKQLEEQMKALEAEKAWRVEYLRKLKGEG